MSSTLYVNLMSGPGAGKSTTAAGLFYRLKRSGFNCELIQEYAKDKTWSEDKQTLLCQPYVTGKQFYRTTRLLDKVEIAITDSPFILGALYQGMGCTPSWENWLFEAFKEFNNLNILLVRNSDNHPYNPMGRHQTEDLAKEKDHETKDLLDKHKIDYFEVEMTDINLETWSDPGLDAIYGLVRTRI